TTINGLGAGIVAVDANNASRAFNIGAGVSVTIGRLAVTNGFAPGGGFGGGIFNAGNLVLNNVTVSHCGVDGNSVQGSQDATGQGGGIYSSGGLTLQACTISFNHATGGDNFPLPSGDVGQPARGGGICSTGSLSISSSSIVSNTAQGGELDDGTATAGDALGGGVYCIGPLSITGS